MILRKFNIEDEKLTNSFPKGKILEIHTIKNVIVPLPSVFKNKEM